jgi:hypothetical protein
MSQVLSNATATPMTFSFSEADSYAPRCLSPQEESEKILEYRKRLVIMSLMSEEEKGKMTLVPSKRKYSEVEYEEKKLTDYTKEEIIELKKEEENLRKKFDWTPENKQRREEILQILKQNPWKEEWDAPPTLCLTRSTTKCYGEEVFSSSGGSLSLKEYQTLRY